MPIESRNYPPTNKILIIKDLKNFNIKKKLLL